MSRRITLYPLIVAFAVLSATVLLSQGLVHKGIGKAGRASESLDYDKEFVTALLDAKSGYVELVESYGLLLETMRGDISQEDLEIKSAKRLSTASIFYQRTVSTLSKLNEEGYEPSVPSRLKGQLQELELEGETPIAQLLALSSRVSMALNALVSESTDVSEVSTRGLFNDADLLFQLSKAAVFLDSSDTF